METAFKIVRLVVVVPIALAVVLTLPVWEALWWLMEGGTVSWPSITRRFIKNVSNFVWS